MIKRHIQQSRHTTDTKKLYLKHIKKRVRYVTWCYSDYICPSTVLLSFSKTIIFLDKKYIRQHLSEC